ncbi:MAG TPA: DUF5724 domain-containing protein [Gemmatimonadaceae bacterium]|nr:DUF5724 domain-containing protein [Gemmatimonadaceae bacterium]
MDQEQIAKSIAARKRPGAVLKRVGALKTLTSMFTGGGVPRPLRALVEETFVADEHRRVTEVDGKRGMVGAQLIGLTPEEWKRGAEALLPHLGPSVIAACDALANRPYQDGYTRKPFRCPRSPQTLADIRGRWLLRTTILLGDYECDIRWVAEHAAFLGSWWGATELGWLLAGALNVGGSTAADVEEILTASARGEHPTAQFGRHVTQAFMSCERESGWEYVEKLLLAAQRQEGLRQVVLESIDEAHPMAFRRMLRLILDEDLARFSSVVRAADTWFGLLWDGSSGVAIDSILRRVLLFLEDDSARTAALDESDAETVYLALWSTAFDDVQASIEPAIALLASPSAEVRFVATHFLVQANWTSGFSALGDQLLDADLRVAARALDNFAGDQTESVDGERLFQNLERLMERVPKRSSMLEPIVWPWHKRKLERTAIASAMSANVTAVAGERLLPYIPDLEPYARASFLRRAAGLPPRWQQSDAPAKPRRISAAERTVVLDLLGDASEETRRAAFDVARTFPLRDDEVTRLIDLLARKPADLRTNALARLRTLDDDALVDAVDRLLADASEPRRLAGLELLRDAVESGRATAAVRDRAARYAADRDTLVDEERAHLTAIESDASDTATRDDALGLVDPRALRKWPAPANRRVDVDTAGARASEDALAELVLAHHTTEVRTASGETKLLVESAGWNFGPKTHDDAVATEPKLPLADVWRRWVRERGDATRDRDGLELVRALLAEYGAHAKRSAAVRRLEGIAQYSAGLRFFETLLEWCVVWEPPAGVPDFLLDGLESCIAGLTAGDYADIEKHERNRSGYYYAGRDQLPYQAKTARAEQWLLRFRWWREIFPASLQAAHAERLFGLLRAFEERSHGAGLLRMTLDDYLPVHRAGLVGEPDFLFQLVGPWSLQSRTTMLRESSARKVHRGLAEAPDLLALVERARRRIVEVETQRGDRVTAASGLVMELRMTGGLETLARALPSLGKAHFARQFGWSSAERSRQETLSHLVVRSVPREEDTHDAFARWAREAKLTDARLVELAVYAPQWAAHVNHVLGWPGLEGGVWWIQAHTKDDRSWQLREMKEIWAAEVSERTALSAVDLTEGAVDVRWFAEVYVQLGPERWKALDTAAKYAASSGGHTRAQLFARAMAGLVTREELLARIEASRHQDSVRALGLLPLAEGDARTRDLLERYERLEKFRRESRKFGSQRQQSEGRAIAIALANLARTAGYRDPQRLQWAMEREAVGELAKGPLLLARGDVAIELSIDAEGKPAMAVTKKGKPLKALPAALKKDSEVEELRERYAALKRQRSRVRDALEEAMCRGDRFSGAELGELLAHPILAPSLASLVFVGDGIAGYLAESGRALRDHAGAMHAVGDLEELRLAHPVDLFERGDWSAWQRECFLAERVQPFKQLFRELYPITESERGTERTRRYAGHQVGPKQALALLGGRGWVARPEEGVSRTFHEAGITVRLGFDEAFYTPADLEGLTLDEVVFTRRGEWKELPLDSIPAALFSEAMRDLDLVVSVAHRGGVAPEATASTVEMRATLLRETCELLGLGNVEVKGSHAIIQGTLGQYSVHLGSAGVMLLPGTYLPIVAVHSQHRGRLFLPFADDDPRSAEVMSKVLLLARDSEIRDPNILDWIRAGQGAYNQQ